MNLTKVFGVVLVVHLLIGSFLLILPGCKSTPRPGSSDQGASVTGNVEPQGFYDSSPSGITGTSGRQAPRRPDGSWPQAGGTTQPAGSDNYLNDFNTIPPDDIIAPAPTGTTRSSTPATTGSGSGSTYTVQRGDSLWVIAQRNNVSLDALLSANNMNRNSVIHPGQELRIPNGSEAPSQPSTSADTSRSEAASTQGGTTHAVVSGDTLSGIARRYGTSVEAIRVANNLTSNNIRIGQRLDIPDGGSAASSAARASTSSSSSSAPVAGPGEDIHVVRPGETPGGIARRYGMTAAELMEMNGIDDPRKLRAGQALVIRSSQAPASTSRTQGGSSSPAPRATQSPSTPSPTPPPPASRSPQNELPPLIPPGGGDELPPLIAPGGMEDEDLSDIPALPLGEEMP